MATYFLSSHIFTVKTPVTETYNLGLDALTTIGFQDASDTGTEIEADVLPEWLIEATPPEGAAVVPTDSAFTWAGVVHFTRDGVVFRGWHMGTGAATEVGAITDQGRISLGISPPGAANAITWHNLARDKRGALDVFDGVFRTPVAPLQAGQLQLTEGALIGSADSGGVITGAFDGLVDAERGIVAWSVADLGDAEGEGTPVRADQLTYNTVFLQAVPINEALLGLGTTRLPLDGKVPGFHVGESAVVHHTLTTELPNPLTKGAVYDLGRERLAHVTLRDATGTRLPGALFESDLNPGTVVIPVGSDITAYTQPITAYHRVEDELAVLRADLSGRIDLNGTLSHDYPAGDALISSKLRLGDPFARVHNVMDRASWLETWDATADGDETTANFDQTNYPITTTDRGAIKERWAAVYITTTTVRVFGEKVGQVLNSAPIAEDIEAVNPQSIDPSNPQPPANFWRIPKEGWGGGYPIGSVLLWETDAAGGPAWICRSTLPGASSVLSDRAVIALRSDVAPT